MIALKVTRVPEQLLPLCYHA